MAAAADILDGKVTEIKLQTGELVTVTCVQDDVIFALKGAIAKSIPAGGAVAIPAQHEYLLVQCAGQTYRSPPGYVQRTVVPGSALDDAANSKDGVCQVSLRTFSFDSPVGADDIYDIREPTLKFELCGEPDAFVLKPRFSGFCPIVTPKCLKIQDGSHKVTDYLWNMEMHPTAEHSRPFACKSWDIRSLDVHCLVQNNGGKVVSEWNISTPQSMVLTVTGSKKPIQFGWSFDDSKNCICFSFGRAPAKQGATTTRTTKTSTRRPARIFLSPCIVSVSLNGKKKAGFGFISRDYSPKVKFFEEDFGGEFDTRYKTSAICFSIHEESPDIRNPESIHYEYFAPECYVDIGSPILLHLFRMLVLIRVFRQNTFTDDFKELMDQYVRDPMDTSAAGILSYCMTCALSGSDCGLEDMEPAMLMEQFIQESQGIFDWDRFLAEDEQFPLAISSDYTVGSQVMLPDNNLLIFASLDGVNPVLPDRAIGQTITSEKYVLVYLELASVE